MSSDVWVFAYGSLMFRPGIAYLERQRAWLVGYERRFFQGSIDHRGTVEAPGRVVTLIEGPGKVGGLAYRIEAERVTATLAELDRREQGGYDRLWAPLHRRELGVDRAPTERDRLGDGVVYLASPQNPWWQGDAALSSMASQIARARGPSGTNADYLFELRRALSEEELDDPHVEELARAVIEVLLDEGLSPALERTHHLKEFEAKDRPGVA